MDVQQRIEATKNTVDAAIIAGASMSLLDWAHWGVAVVTIVLGLMRIIIEAPKLAERFCKFYAWIKSKIGRK